MNQRVTNRQTEGADVFPNNLSGGNQAQIRQLIRDEINQPTEAKYFAPMGHPLQKFTTGQVLYVDGWNYSTFGSPGLVVFDIGSNSFLPLTQGRPNVNPNKLEINVSLEFLDANGGDARYSTTAYHGLGWVELETGAGAGNGIAQWATPWTVFYGDSTKDWLISIEIMAFSDQAANAAGADTAYIFGFCDDPADHFTSVRTAFYADPASANWQLKSNGTTVNSGVPIGVGYDNRQNLRLVMRNKDGQVRTDFYIDGVLKGQILEASEDIAQAFGFSVSQQSVSNNVICTVGAFGMNAYFPT